MKLLFATSHLPYPPYSGGRLREFEIIKRLCKYCEIYLCVITNTYEADKENIQHIEKYCKEVKLYPGPENHLYSLQVRQKVPEQVLRNTCDKALGYVATLLQNETISVIHLEGFYMVSIIPKYVSVPIVLTEQNIEYVLWNQKYHHEKEKLKREYYLEQHLITKEIEIHTWKRAAKCVALTMEDKKIMEQVLGADKVTLVPDGIDHLLQENKGNKVLKRAIESPSVIFVANFAYYPNRDAAIYFFEQIYQPVISKLPDVNFYFVGNDPNNVLGTYKELPNVHVTGRVASLLEYYLHSDVIMCPLRIGGGVKVKMLEAISFGKAIVTTTVGAQGLRNGGDEEAIVVRDDPNAFAESIISILTDKDYRKRTEEKSLLLSGRLPKWDEIVAHLHNSYMTGA